MRSSLARARPRPRARVRLDDVYARLLRWRGPAGWWPARSAFEVCVGAVLVQNTNWGNVEKALAVLRSRGILTYEGLAALGAEALAPLIRSAGCFNVKARRLRALLDFLGQEYGGQVEAMSREDPLLLRAKLLEVEGIGRETADSIVLYAAGLPLFVVDAYTRRVFARLGVISGHERYDEIQRLFMAGLPRDAALFNDYHAQVVLLAKEVCRPRPVCTACPLDALCARQGVHALSVGGSTRPETSRPDVLE